MSYEALPNSQAPKQPVDPAQGQMSAREFLDKPENDLGFGKHRNNCGETLIDGLCLRCRVETVMEAFARSHGEVKNG